MCVVSSRRSVYSSFLYSSLYAFTFVGLVFSLPWRSVTLVSSVIFCTSGPGNITERNGIAVAIHPSPPCQIGGQWTLKYLALDLEEQLAIQAKERMLAGKAPDPEEHVPQGRASEKVAIALSPPCQLQEDDKLRQVDGVTVAIALSPPCQLQVKWSS